MIVSLDHKSESSAAKPLTPWAASLPVPKSLCQCSSKPSRTRTPTCPGSFRSRRQVGPSRVPALIEALRDDKVAIRQQAVRALGDIGSDAKKAMPNLRALLFENASKLQPEAAEALGKIGKASIPTLVEATKNDNATVRQLAVSGLAKVGPPAVPDLVDAAGSKFVDVRRQAAPAPRPQNINDKWWFGSGLRSEG